MGRRSIFLVLAFLAGFAPASALEFSVSGAVLTMSGPIRSGDEFQFEALMRRVPPGSIRIVRLNSPGGRIVPAREIARAIRRNGWTTFIPAGARCASACTGLFAAGTRRHYVGGTFPDGLVPRAGVTGLAYHQGNDPLSRDSNRFSGQATAAMISMYYEFGASAAVSLINRAPPERFWRVSGQTALSLGLATSLSAP